MVKLVTAREIRCYGPWSARNRAEYINAGLYVFATVLLICGFLAQFSVDTGPGSVLLLIALVIIIAVNVHDLVAHAIGIDCLLSLFGYDKQLALVEFAVPVVQALGTALWFVGLLFLFLEEVKGRGYIRLENHALNMVIAGSALWVLGSVHNACQVYERADVYVQFLQETVHVPFLAGSLLFLIGSVLHTHRHTGFGRHGLKLLGGTLVWMSLFGSILFFIGGLANVLKVYKMQQGDGLLLEKLRGGAQERLFQSREGHMPLLSEDPRRSRRASEETRDAPSATHSTPYKDVLTGQA